MRARVSFKKLSLLGVATSLLVTGLGAPAGANSDPVVADEVVASDDLSERLVDLGVAEDVRAALVSKWESGQAWDSMTGVEPISTSTTEEGEWVVTRSVYPDGSVSQVSLETPKESSGAEIGLRAKPLNGCKSLPNSGGWVRRADCTADAKYGVYDLYFNVDYSVKSGGGRIDKAYNGRCPVVPPASTTNCTLKTNRPVNNGSVPAQARLSATITTPVGGSIPVWLQVEAYGSAWVTNN